MEQKPTTTQVIEEAQQALEQAHLEVATAAREVADRATPTSGNSGAFLVPAEEMQTLKEAVRVWSTATNAFLAALHAAEKAA